MVRFRELYKGEKNQYCSAVGPVLVAAVTSTTSYI